MALPAFSGPVPSSGLGNIGAAFGPPNSPGAMAPRSPLAPQLQAGAQALQGQPNAGAVGAPMANAGMAGFLGAAPPPANPGVAPPMGANAQMAQPQGGLAGVFSQMDPAHANAIRNIPPQAMQALHGAGMIHPALMQHLYGNQNRY